MTKESSIPSDPILWWLLHRGEYAAATARGGWSRRTEDGLGLTIEQIARLANVSAASVKAEIMPALPGARVGLKYNSGRFVPNAFFDESYTGMFHESGRAELDALAERFGV